MKKYAAAYALWLFGVLSAALVAFYYYRKVLALGEDELHKVLSPDGARSSEDAASSPPPAEPPASDEVARKRGSAG